MLPRQLGGVRPSSISKEEKTIEDWSNIHSKLVVYSSNICCPAWIRTNVSGSHLDGESLHIRLFSLKYLVRGHWVKMHDLGGKRRDLTQHR